MYEKPAADFVIAQAGTSGVSRPLPQGNALPGFPNAQKVRAKTPPAAVGGAGGRWKTAES
jgi:hypothetical protein